MFTKFASGLALCAVLLVAGQAQAADAKAIKGGAKAEMTLVNETGLGKSVGTVTFIDTPQGLEITPDLMGLPPGPHGFHVHEFASCEAQEKDGKKTPALAAGGHYDPQKSGKHAEPGKGGHMGDLPLLEVGADGKATMVAHVKDLKVQDLRDHALMIHAGGDNYSDQPMPLGGGGARIACGVIK